MMHKEIVKTAEVLKSGGIILYPSDSGWGIGCDATNQAAVERIYRIKRQKTSAGMMLLMENPALLERYVQEVPEIAWDLVEVSTTPLIIIFPAVKNVAPNLAEKDGSIGIQIIREEFTVQLLQRFRKPLVFTPAVIEGKKSPASFGDISAEIIKQADYVVEYRQEDVNPGREPGIIKLWPGGRIDIIRKEN